MQANTAFPAVQPQGHLPEKGGQKCMGIKVEQYNNRFGTYHMQWSWLVIRITIQNSDFHLFKIQTFILGQIKKQKQIDRILPFKK